MSQSLGHRLSGNLRNLTPGLFCLQRPHADLGPVAEFQPLSDEQSSDQQLPVPQCPLFLFLLLLLFNEGLFILPSSQQHISEFLTDNVAISSVGTLIQLSSLSWPPTQPLLLLPYSEASGPFSAFGAPIDIPGQSRDRCQPCRRQAY